MPKETTTAIRGRDLETSPYGVTWAPQATHVGYHSLKRYHNES